VKTLQELVTHLLMAAHAYTGYDLPAESPEVRFVPQVEIRQMACDRPCKVYGWYPHGKTIYLDDRLDPVHDVAARGILLHELVHYLQQSAGAFETSSACRNWADREREAYMVQGRWLTKQGSTVALFPGGGLVPWKLACRQERVQHRD